MLLTLTDVEPRDDDSHAPFPPSTFYHFLSPIYLLLSFPAVFVFLLHSTKPSAMSTYQPPHPYRTPIPIISHGSPILSPFDRPLPAIPKVALQRQPFIARLTKRFEGFIRPRAASLRRSSPPKPESVAIEHLRPVITLGGKPLHSFHEILGSGGMIPLERPASMRTSTDTQPKCEFQLQVDASAELQGFTLRLGDIQPSPSRRRSTQSCHPWTI